MKTAERLAEYYPFTQSIIDHVSEIAERQAHAKTYEQFLASTGVGELVPVSIDGHLSAQVVDVRPKNENPEETIMMYLPMANALDPNQLYAIGTLALTFPNSRIIAAGNPSGPGYGAGALNHKQRKAVASGDFRPVVEPVVAYAEQEEVSRALQLGDSYGADLAATAAAMDAFAVPHIITIEPASVMKRSVKKLGDDFKSTEKALEGYVNANELQTFLEARKKSVSGNSYIAGLLRLTNIAVARGLAKGGFDRRMFSALRAQREMEATVVWGGRSELANDESVHMTVSRLRSLYLHRVKSLRLVDEKHAMTNDLHLRSAIIMQALEN